MSLTVWRRILASLATSDVVVAKYMDGRKTKKSSDAKVLRLENRLIDALTVLIKRYALVLAGILVVLLATIVHVMSASSGEFGKLGNVRGIHKTGSGDLQVSISRQPELTGIGRVVGDRLYISGSSDVAATIKTLEALESSGSGDTKVYYGGGRQLSIIVYGSGDVTVSDQGRNACVSVSIHIYGSGQVDASKLGCQRARVEIVGSGDALVNVRDVANLEIYGSGSIMVFGEKPSSVSEYVLGSGDIEYK